MAKTEASFYASYLCRRLKLDSIGLVYQGQIDPRHDNYICAAEALLRATRDGEAVPPVVLVREAENHAAGDDLAYWTAIQASEDASFIFARRPGRIRINLQEKQIANSDFISRLEEYWGRDGKKNPGVDVEVVETDRVPIGALSFLAGGLRRLLQMRAHIILDDWVGSAEDHIRLTTIRQFSKATVKLDKSWFSCPILNHRLFHEIKKLQLLKSFIIAEGACRHSASLVAQHFEPHDKEYFWVQSFVYHSPEGALPLANRINTNTHSHHGKHLQID